ncbi:DUF4861 family protein [Galbibacter sp. EGI 63066]|uniref:DUF4861 family protein n=1 Tax=Galbibacter sp. EGI 63066 TaxID=2993559 RepID=UPI002249496F|nr:DUF4861 family protein [Galbibacter sp. EGI 63066]MCX2678396.1 DUF4861 family protein [Galbibacter sp. EGI 63066]
MKKSSLILCSLLTASLIGCKTETKKEEKTEVTVETEEVEKAPKTYAEISVREGGEWVDRKYEGGSAFKNVESLDVPKEHTDHSYYIRYEGPGWESDKVGYRLYLDWRNAIDIFGKKTDDMVLPNVGQDNFDSYHEMSDWGMDILKAGKSLGIGSIGRFKDGKVLHFEEVDATSARVENKTDASSVYIDYTGWATADEKIDLKSKLSITPEHRYTKHTITPSKAIEGICTGIVKFDGIDLIKKQSESNNWAYIATYGEQTLVPDKLGMVIFYKTSDIEKSVEGPDDHLLIFKPTDKAVSYYFLGAWEKEKDGITTKEAFVKHIDQLLNQLDQNGKL